MVICSIYVLFWFNAKFRLSGPANDKIKIRRKDIDVNGIKPKFLKRAENAIENKSTEKVSLFFLHHYILPISFVKPNGIDTTFEERFSKAEDQG